MNGFFDGDFRRKPNVSIGGASRKLNKEELLAKAQKEREERQVRINLYVNQLLCKILLFSISFFQVVRLKNASALKIQCCFRSFTARKRAKNVMRNKFDALKANYKTNDDLRNELICHLLYFYDIDQDGQRLVSANY